jgi:hypothetical protein
MKPKKLKQINLRNQLWNQLENQLYKVVDGKT